MQDHRKNFTNYHMKMIHYTSCALKVSKDSFLLPNGCWKHWNAQDMQSNYIVCDPVFAVLVILHWQFSHETYLALALHRMRGSVDSCSHIRKIDHGVTTAISSRQHEPLFWGLQSLKASWRQLLRQESNQSLKPSGKPALCSFTPGVSRNMNSHNLQ